MARLASKKFSESAWPGNDAVNRPEARMRRIYLVPCANQHGITGMRQMTVNNETFPVFHGRQFVDSSNPFLPPLSQAIRRIAFGIEWQDTV